MFGANKNTETKPSDRDQLFLQSNSLDFISNYAIIGYFYRILRNSLEMSYFEPRFWQFTLESRSSQFFHIIQIIEIWIWPTKKCLYTDPLRPVGNRQWLIFRGSGRYGKTKLIFCSFVKPLFIYPFKTNLVITILTSLCF